MTEDSELRKQADDLRKRAEEKARANETRLPDALSTEETQRLIHELQVHQIELEMQNEELRRTQAELEFSRARYFDLYDLAPVGYLTVSEKGLILEANIAVSNMLGVERSVLVKQPLSRYIVSEDQDIYYLNRKEIFDTGVARSFDIRFLRAGAAPVWARVDAIAERNAAGVLECRAVVIDISERRLNEQKIIHLASFPEMSPQPVMEVNAAGEVIYHNPATKNILAELGLGRGDAKAFLPDDFHAIAAEWDKTAVLKLYRERWIKDRVFGATIQLLPKFNAVRIYATEITQRKLSEEALRRSHDEMETRVRLRTEELFQVNERLLVEIALHRSSVEEVEESREELRELARHLQKAKEDERLRISREIHDELGQMLTGLKMDLDFIKNGLPEAQQELYEKVDSDIGMIDEIIRAIKRICDELRPSLLDHFGIEAAIEWHAEEFQKSTGIVCKVASGLGDCDVDVDRSTALFRIFQESLTNVARHSGATAVTAKLQRVNGSIVLMISDNGKGISSDQQIKPRSFGLIGMRERALQLGGDIEVISAEGKGTTVKATIPIECQDRPE